VYDDLFNEWESILKFQVGGWDYTPDDRPEHPNPAPIKK
jgi:hypothetical protein